MENSRWFWIKWQAPAIHKNHPRWMIQDGGFQVFGGVLWKLVIPHSFWRFSLPWFQIVFFQTPFETQNPWEIERKRSLTLSFSLKPLLISLIEEEINQIKKSHSEIQNPNPFYLTSHMMFLSLIARRRRRGHRSEAARPSLWVSISHLWFHILECCNGSTFSD